MTRRDAIFLTACLATAPVSASVPERDPITKNRYRAEDLALFTDAKEWTVFSLDPSPWEETELFPAPVKPGAPYQPPKEPKRKVPPEQEFHGYHILGQIRTPVTDNLKTVITTLDEAGRRWSGAVAACFSPRHGIRVIKDGDAYDLVICYECMAAYIYRNADHIGSVYFVVDAQYLPRPAYLNGVLIRGKIKLRPEPRR